MKNGGMKYISQLRPAEYQVVPLLKLLTNRLKCILISDGVGVGKTISAGYALLYLSTYLRQSAIVVCPPSLLIKWKVELEVKFSLRAVIITKDEEFASMEDELQAMGKNKKITVYIIPTSLINKFRFNKKTKSSIIVFDEIHNFRNNETIGYSAAKRIASHADYRVGLSATPINNSMKDFVSELSILLPHHSWNAIDIMVEDMWHRNKSRITNALVTRFTKENLGIHFAKRMIENYDVAYPPEYIDKVKEIISEIPSSRNSFFEKVTYYRLAASSSEAFRRSTGMEEVLIENDPKIVILKKILIRKKIDRWVIFCEFSETAKVIQMELSKDWHVLLMTGDTPLFERHNVINEFRKTTKSILLMTPVGSEGLDIQFCNAILNFDLHWNPMKIEQRIGRVDRVGQKEKKIFVVNLMVLGSIDEKILEVIERKLSLISTSVFNVPPLVSERSSEVKNIFDKEVFQAEYNMGKNLLKSIKYWESLPALDYSILSKIDKKFCDAEFLSKMAKSHNTDWFLSSTGLKKWVSKVQSDSYAILERIDLYS